MEREFIHLAGPAEFRDLPRLNYVGMESRGDVSFRIDMSQRPNEPQSLFQYTIDGYGLLHYHGTVHKIDKGKAFIINKRDPDISFYYPPGEVKSWDMAFCDFTNCENLVEALNTRYGPIYDFGTDCPVVQKLISMIKSHKQHEVDIANSESYSVCSDIIEEMCRLIELKDRGHDGSLATKARHLLFKQRNNNFSLPLLAESLGTSREHLCREFKRRFDLTPKHFHDAIRVELISDQLRNSTRSIKEVAQEFEFDDVSNFIKFFKKHSQMTPGQFRRNHSVPIP